MQGFSGRIVTKKNLNGIIDKPKTLVDSDYGLLENKPSIEGVTLVGNKSLEDFGLIFDGETIIKENGILTVADNSHRHTVGNIEGLQEALDVSAAHAADTDNPHGVTKSQLGLGNVENKSSAAIRGELTKTDVTGALGFEPPTGGDVETALSVKADKTALQAVESSLDTHTANTGNPHGVTKSQIGLGNVENKSSAAIRGELTKANVVSALGYTPSSETGAAETISSTVRRRQRPSDLFKIF